MKTLDFWFDYSCPYAYVASTGVEAFAADLGARVRWRPILLGGVLRAVGSPQHIAATLPPAKARHLLVDQARLAALAGVPFDPPPEHPRRTVAALRATLARGNDPAVIHAFFRAYWAERRPIEDEAVVRAIAGDVDLDAAREPLRAQTDAAIAMGVFGVPVYGVGDRWWWGGDRLPLVRAALEAA